MRDHGGDLDRAIARFGGDMADWIDLSTGINRRPWPMSPVPESAWRRLPTAQDHAGLIAAARGLWRVHPELAAVALAGAQAAIQTIPRLHPPGRARVLVPTYNEHAGALAAQGWQVEEGATLAALAGADVAVVVNPNNPDGQCHAPEALLALADRVGLLVVDESFGDVAPGLSLLPLGGRALVLRSFGKFWGLAGLRLGFAFGPAPLVARLAALAGPWPVSGAAIAAGTAALSDPGWAAAMRETLAADAARADALAQGAGWRLVGGTTLFRLYDVGRGTAAQERLARHHIWSRVFPHAPRWLRLGLPGPEGEWSRLAAALAR
ncbi:MAG: threonine-phosphate decarboxylase [Rubellimicrobium sp.]|nr:threonine-phosphate decarboxylase [Rubellimicrobium sp.]